MNARVPGFFRENPRPYLFGNEGNHRGKHAKQHAQSKTQGCDRRASGSLIVNSVALAFTSCPRLDQLDMCIREVRPEERFRGHQRVGIFESIE